MALSASQPRVGDEASFSAADVEIIQRSSSDHIVPHSVTFSPDDKLVSYVVTPESSLGTQIFIFDLEKKEQRLLLTLPEDDVGESQDDSLLACETKQRRRLGDLGSGFGLYGWATGATGPTVMVSLSTGIYIMDQKSAELRLRVPSMASAPVSDAKLSPDGRSVAYVMDAEIYVTSATEGDPVQVTSGARGTGKTNGIANTEVLGETERRPGFWWSADSRYIAFLEVDATGVLNSPPGDQGENGDVLTSPTGDQGENGDVLTSPTGDQGQNGDDCDGNLSVHKAATNVFVRLGIVAAAGGEVSWVELLIGGTEHEDEEHLASVMWLPENFLVAEVESHDKSKCKLLKFSPSTGKRQILLEEKNNNANKCDCFTPLKTGGFIWVSERTGITHMYLYDALGECLGPLTDGSLAVEKVLGVDENAGLVYFMGSSNPLESHLYSTLIFPDKKFPIGSPTQLTEGECRHIVVIDHLKQRFVDIQMEDTPRVYIRHLTYSRLSVVLGLKSEDMSTPQPPQQLSLPSEAELQQEGADELQRAASVLLKHYSSLLDGVCRQCKPLLERRLARLAHLDTTTMDHSLNGDYTGEHSDSEDQHPSIAIADHTETANGNGFVDHAGNHSEVQDETVQTDTAPKTLVRDLTHPVAVNGNGNGIVDDDDNTVSHSGIEDETRSMDTSAGTPGVEKGIESTDGIAATSESALSDTYPEKVGRQEKPRLWSDEQSSGSEVDEDGSPQTEDPQAGILGPHPNAANKKVPSTATVESKQTPAPGQPLSFPSHSAGLNYAWTNAHLPSPRDGDKEAQASNTAEPSLEERNGTGGQVVRLKSVSILPREEREARRLQGVVRKKDFECFERVNGRMVNVVDGLELHSKMFSAVEQQRLIDLAYEWRDKGRKGLLRGRTYTEPRKWMVGKGRVTIQFGCCYNYALDKAGNPPGIMHDEFVDELPDLLKSTIRRLVRWAVLPEDCVPDSCIINIYEVGDCIPPHIDHHDFVRPFCTLSLQSECNILFGTKLNIVGEGKFDGPFSLPLPVGSVLVLKGNGADLAKHAVPGVPTTRISITFRKMNPRRVPRGYKLPSDLRDIKAAPQLR